MRGYAAVGLFNSKTEANVGGAMRAAGCYGASLVVIQGQRFKRCPTDTIKAWRHIPLIQNDDLFSAIPYDCVPIAIEIVDGAKSLEEFSHPERGFYVFGPEDGTLPPSIVSKCRHVVSIPTKYCMNLAATVNVVLYDRIAKQRQRK